MLFYLHHRHILARHFQNLRVPPGEVVSAVFVAPSTVAREEPAVAKRCRGGLRVVHVALEQANAGFARYSHFADFARCCLVAVFVLHLHSAARRDPAHAQRVGQIV